MPYEHIFVCWNFSQLLQLCVPYRSLKRLLFQLDCAKESFFWYFLPANQTNCFLRIYTLLIHLALHCQVINGFFWGGKPVSSHDPQDSHTTALGVRLTALESIENLFCYLRSNSKILDICYAFPTAYSLRDWVWFCQDIWLVSLCFSHHFLYMIFMASNFSRSLNGSFSDSLFHQGEQSSGCHWTHS